MNTTTTTAIAVCLLSAACACSSTAHTQHGQSSTNAQGGAVPPDATKDAVQSTPLPQLTTVLPDGRTALLRPALKELQRRGSQRFIQGVRVRPAFHRQKFYGWTIMAYEGPGELLQGDIILRINQQSIERPEQFIAVWNGMAQQPSLMIEMVRKRRKLRLSFPIVDQ